MSPVIAQHALTGRWTRAASRNVARHAAGGSAAESFLVGWGTVTSGLESVMAEEGGASKRVNKTGGGGRELHVGVRQSKNMVGRQHDATAV